MDSRTEVVRLFTPEQPLLLASGEQLTEVDVAYQTYGSLNTAGDNAIYICHALTGDAHAAGLDERGRRGWWDNLIGPGRPVDTDRWFVVCSNLLGGCQGTTGPSSVDPATGRPYGLSFPLLDMSDFVTVHRALGRHLGVQHWRAAIGGSLGGMQVLDWALRHPSDLDAAVIIAASSRLTAQNIAFSAVGRQAIMRDRGFSSGHPDIGLAIARMMAHITYLSEEAFSEKFGRAAQGTSHAPGFGIDFAVESYLDHQGESFLARFDALSYLYLTRVMDYFDPFARPDALAALGADPLDFLVLSFDTDWRFSTAHSRRIVRKLESARQSVTFRDIHSPWGHDSFLLDNPAYHATVREFLQAPVQPARAKRQRARQQELASEAIEAPSGKTSDRIGALRPDLALVASLIAPGSRVLDLGCGGGELLSHLAAERDCAGTGVEIDPDSVLDCIRAGVPVIELNLDSQLDEFRDDSYDTVVLSRTLQAVHRPAVVLREIARIAPHMVVSMPNFGLLRHRLRLAGGHMPANKDLPYSWHDTPNLHYSTLVDLEELFDESGLVIEQRLPLDDAGRPMPDRRGRFGANLRASSAVYLLSRAPA